MTTSGDYPIVECKLFKQVTNKYGLYVTPPGSSYLQNVSGYYGKYFLSLQDESFLKRLGLLYVSYTQVFVSTHFHIDTINHGILETNGHY